MNSTLENTRSLSLLPTWKNSLYLRRFAISILTIALYLHGVLPLISSGKANPSTSASIYTPFEPALITPYMFSKHAFDVTKHIYTLNDRLADISRRDGKRDRNEVDIFLDTIVIVERELGYISSNISHLMVSYHLLRHQYREYNSSYAEALKVLEPNGLRRRAILGGYETWAYLGLNFTKMYWDPWVEAIKTAEAARLDLAALEDELSRLEKITQVALETCYHLNRLAYIVHGGPTEGNFYRRTDEARAILRGIRLLWGELVLEDFKIDPTVSALLLDVLGL